MTNKNEVPGDHTKEARGRGAKEVYRDESKLSKKRSEDMMSMMDGGKVERLMGGREVLMK